MKIIRSAKELQNEIDEKTRRCTCPECHTYSPIEFIHRRVERSLFFTKTISTTRHTCLECGCVWED